MNPIEASETPLAQRGRRFLALGCALSAVGLGLAGSVSTSVGGIALVAGWILAVAGLHLYGRG
jgi:hypothetical protein